MNLLGFTNEHVRFDRDKYIEIKWENVIPGAKHVLDKIVFDDIIE